MMRNLTIEKQQYVLESVWYVDFEGLSPLTKPQQSKFKRKKTAQLPISMTSPASSASDSTASTTRVCFCDPIDDKVQRAEPSVDEMDKYNCQDRHFGQWLQPQETPLGEECSSKSSKTSSAPIDIQLPEEFIMRLKKLQLR
ncbi:hypothetical protein CHS0354_009846 [Potamilus streckersoni]|uniref:Uncharacterized protein n=1 Tax=Potamilus streckersoni TaxID=2493646 RepID=A0AAE0SXE2_9BIVA|nr:hypothetical protein CHS0354_009846 [Potamilus streckersoni]